MKKLAYGLLIIGAILVLLAIGLTSYSNIKYNQLVSKFEENYENLSFLENIKDSENTDTDKITDDMIGLIEIPSINLKYPILEGTDEKVLKQAVGHFESSALPGEGSNMTLIGHNNFILSEPFKKLDKVKEGDSVSIKTIDNQYHYEVVKIYTVDPYNKDIVKRSDETKLTLVTCTDDTSKRLVVEALLLNDNIIKDK